MPGGADYQRHSAESETELNGRHHSEELAILRPELLYASPPRHPRPPPGRLGCSRDTVPISRHTAPNVTTATSTTAVPNRSRGGASGGMGTVCPVRLTATALSRCPIARMPPPHDGPHEVALVRSPAGRIVTHRAKPAATLAYLDRPKHGDLTHRPGRPYQSRRSP